jgi:hypothetical protein
LNLIWNLPSELPNHLHAISPLAGFAPLASLPRLRPVVRAVRLNRPGRRSVGGQVNSLHQHLDAGSLSAGDYFGSFSLRQSADGGQFVQAAKIFVHSPSLML